VRARPPLIAAVTNACGIASFECRCCLRVVTILPSIVCCCVRYFYSLIHEVKHVPAGLGRETYWFSDTTVPVLFTLLFMGKSVVSLLVGDTRDHACWFVCVCVCVGGGDCNPLGRRNRLAMTPAVDTGT
jgi:hypothetical protein